MDLRSRIHIDAEVTAGAESRPVKKRTHVAFLREVPREPFHYPRRWAQREDQLHAGAPPRPAAAATVWGIWVFGWKEGVCGANIYNDNACERIRRD